MIKPVLITVAVVLWLLFAAACVTVWVETLSDALAVGRFVVMCEGRECVRVDTSTGRVYLPPKPPDKRGEGVNVSE